MNIFVLFGITGDLAKQKVIPALARMHDKQEKETGTSASFFIGVGRKPLPPEEFAMFKEGIYVSGDLEAAVLYKKILSLIKKQVAASKKLMQFNLVMYSSLPPHVHVKVAELFKKEVGMPLLEQIEKKNAVKFSTKKQPKKTKFNIRLVIEKPIGSSFADAEAIFGRLQKFPPEFEFYFVDHYLAKEPLVYLQKLAGSNPQLFSKNLGSEHLKEIKVMLFEQKDVATRGAFYDAVGALFDTGQNHMLQVMAACLLLRQRIMTTVQDVDNDMNNTHPALTQAQSLQMAKRLKLNKIAILNALRLHGQPQFGQYSGYLETPNVSPLSTTETFYAISFKAPDKEAKTILALRDVICTITSGKALPSARSGIELWYGNGKMDFIDLSKGEKDAYQILFEAVLRGDQSVFAQKDEILASWKIAERAKKLKTTSGLVVYRKAHDILK